MRRAVGLLIVVGTSVFGPIGASAMTVRQAYTHKVAATLRAAAAGEPLVSHAGLTLTRPTVTPDGRALVDVYVDGDVGSAAAALRRAGMDVRAVSTHAPERMVEGYLPLSATPAAAAPASTQAIVPVQSPELDSGSVISQGDAAHLGPQARALGATGAGVTVGIMSDSINDVGGGIAASQATGDLPANVTDLGDAPGGADEGRAIGEVIYDEAPGVTNMVFDTGLGGAATKAANIAALVAHGAKVIVDDTAYLGEPFFQDGVVSQAVDQAKAAGVAYVAAAGNNGTQSWEGTFTPIGGLNDFGGGDTRQAVVDLPAQSAVTINLQWDEPWANAPDRFEIDVFADNVAAYACLPTGSLPLVTCGVNNNGSTAREIEIQMKRTAGTGTPRLKYIAHGNFGPFLIKEHPTNSSTINPDAAAAKGALAAASACWTTSAGSCLFGAGLQTPETVSSRGPVTRTRDVNGNPLATPEVRQKPDVAGAAEVSTTVPDLTTFAGTSAAAASVGGIAALVLSARPGITAAQADAILTNPLVSLDCTSAPGDPDTDCGSGFLQADRAVTEAITPPAVAATLSPTAPNGSNGWYTTPVGVSWTITDANPAVLTTSGCGASTVSTDGSQTLTCSASGAGGAKSGSVSFKLDTSPPAPPVIRGIAAKRYTRARLPKRSKITCRSSDPTSGVSGCAVNGYSRRVGKHTLTATATNGAGLSASRKLRYTVIASCRPVKHRRGSHCPSGRKHRRG